METGETGEMKKLEAMLLFVVLAIPASVILVLILSIVSGHPIELGALAQVAACF